MTPKTSLDYQKLTEHFFLTKVSSPLSISSIESALLDSALDYRPAYWRRLKRAIQHTLEHYGRKKAAKIIGTLQNPVTAPNSPLQKLKKPKQKRVKRVSQQEHEKLLKHFISKNDCQMLGALEIVRILGCRPSELVYIKLLSDRTIFISSAKKTEDVLRGLDRTLCLDEETHKCFVRAYSLLNLEYSTTTHDCSVIIKRLQRRLQTATKSLWPRRHHHITFYSYRHQLGSDLKSSGLPPQTIAAIMGHQSTASVERYGDKRNGITRMLPFPAQATTNKVRSPKESTRVIARGTAARAWPPKQAMNRPQIKTY